MEGLPVRQIESIFRPTPQVTTLCSVRKYTRVRTYYTIRKYTWNKEKLCCSTRWYKSGYDENDAVLASAESCWLCANLIRWRNCLTVKWVARTKVKTAFQGMFANIMHAPKINILSKLGNTWRVLVPDPLRKE
jgi:hypothetical protein